MRIAATASLFYAAAVLGAPSVDPGLTLWEARCATCHNNPGVTKAPPLSALKQMTAARVFFSMTNGVMKTQAAGLSFPEIARLTAYASAGQQPDYAPSAASMCGDRDVDAEDPRVATWGFDESGSRALDKPLTSIGAANVAKLELAWAFGLPGVTDTRSQPVATAETLFVGASSGHVFALDRRTGCVKWHVATPLRTALTLGRLARDGTEAATLFFGDMAGFVTAMDAATGRVVWRERAGIFDASMLTGAIAQAGDKLIVPISSIEVGLAANPTYECCKTHGAVRALAAASGEVLWTTRLVGAPAATTKSATGVQLWGPSGVPVWSAPTVDAKRGVVYVGTGENYSAPATEMSDAIVALRLDDGRIEWHFQALAGDTYNSACDGLSPGPNCPSPRGPDFDFGASVIVARDSRGRELLLAGQKSGDVWALDPDAKGKVIWRQRVGSGSPLGGVHWGIAMAHGRVYVPIADPQYPIPGYEPKPGLYALGVDDGATAWTHPVERGCNTDLMSYFQRTELYPDCSFYYGFSAAPTVVGDVVIVGALDGNLRAFASGDGKPLWSFATAREFDAVNGVATHGGSIDAAGAIAVEDMLYVQSGYGQFAQLPGNALLAFRLRD